MDAFKHLVKATKKAKPFLGGLLLGTVGLKALGSRDAKRLYANVIAKGYEVRDSIEASIDDVKQQGDDVLADAQAIYQANKEKEELAALESLENETETDERDNG